jgi:hypothetical protein
LRANISRNFIVDPSSRANRYVQNSYHDEVPGAAAPNPNEQWKYHHESLEACSEQRRREHKGRNHFFDSMLSISIFVSFERPPLKIRGGGYFKQNPSIASFQHGVLESRLTWKSLEHPANLDAGNPCRHDEDLHFHSL